MALLRFEGVRKRYRRGLAEVRALEDVTFDVHAGEVVAVYGERGAGKTTLLKTAAGFERPDEGAVTFEGTSLPALSRRRLARVHRERIGWVDRAGPHSAELAMCTYLALPLYGLGPTEAERRALRALDRVGAADCASARWGDLSDTARALVSLASALVRQPRLLLLDDPFASLGIVDRERVLGLLREAADEGGLGVLLATPDMPALLHADAVHALSRGRLLSPAGQSDDPGTVLQFPRSRRTA